MARLRYNKNWQGIDYWAFQIIANTTKYKIQLNQNTNANTNIAKYKTTKNKGEDSKEILSEKNRASVAVESEVSIQALKVQNRTCAENYRLRKKNESELSREKYFSRNRYYVNDYKKRQIENANAINMNQWTMKQCQNCPRHTGKIFFAKLGIF